MIHRLTRFSLRNGAVIVIAMLMVVFGGIYSYLNVPEATYPNVEIPYVDVVIPYPGATPKQSYNDIGKVLEPKLQAIQGLKNLFSMSGTNFQSFTLEMHYGPSISEVDRDIQDALNQVQLPANASKPVIKNETASSSPSIYSVAVTSSTADAQQIQSYLQNNVVSVLQSIRGVSQIKIDGTSPKNIYVEADPKKMKSYGITWQELQQALLDNNFAAPVGNITVGKQAMPLVFNSALSSVSAIANMPITFLKEDTSGLTHAFTQVQSGFTTTGSELGRIATNEGYIQAEVQVMEGLQQLSGQWLADSGQLQGLQRQLQQDPALQKQLGPQSAALSQRVRLEAQQIAVLQRQLKGLQEKVTFPSADAASNIKSGTSATVSPGVRATTVRLSDIARVVYRTDPTTAVYTRDNGKPAVLVEVIPTSDANTVQVVKQVAAKLQANQWPATFKWQVQQNVGKDVQSSVSSMLQEALLGALFAVIVTLLFLRELRATLVAVCSIPISLFAAVIFMYSLGYSLNVLTLSGLAVAVGRVVDDSIVVIENIYRRLRTSERERNEHFLDDATSEVGTAVTSSTLTTIAVFLPMTVVPGIVGHMFAPFAWTVVIALIVSLLVALMVVPLIAKFSLLRIKPKEHGEGWLQRGYRHALDWSLRHKWIVVLVSLLLFTESLVVATRLPIDFLPNDRFASFTIGISMPTASTVRAADGVARQIEKIVAKTNGISSYLTVLSNTQAEVDVEVAPSVKNTDAFGNLLRAKLSSVTGAKLISVTGNGGVGNNQFYLVMNDPNYPELARAAARVVSALQKIPGLTDVQSSNQANMPQINVNINNAAVQRYGLDPAMVAGQVQYMVNGVKVTTIDLDGQNTDVLLMSGGGTAASLAAVRQQTLQTPTGASVPLGEVATLSFGKGPTEIDRFNAQQYIAVTGLISAQNQGAVVSGTNKAIAALHLPSSITFTQEGAAQSMNQGFTDIGLAMVVSFLLVLIAMLITFGEWMAPLAIVFALPFAVVGGFNGLWLTGQALGMPGMIGFLMLIGIVVTNAIVYMDRVQRQIKHGLAVRAALIEAGVVRLRPILMTATATIGAMIPLAITSDAGLISKTLAIVVIGGLTTSTLLTLVMVPIVYEWFVIIRNRIFGDRQRDDSLSDGHAAVSVTNG